MPQEGDHDADAVFIHYTADDFDPPFRRLRQLVPQRGHNGEVLGVEEEPDGLQSPALGEGAQQRGQHAHRALVGRDQLALFVELKARPGEISDPPLELGDLGVERIDRGVARSITGFGRPGR